MSAIAWGRLLRVSLAPSAAADALAGITVGAWGAFPLDARAALVPLASLCVFHGGMALNDWADRAGDARTRPDRPIPSGAVPAASALRAAVALLVAGPLLAALVSPIAGAILGAVALTATCYDLAGRGVWLGPTLLGLCRAGNLAAGLAAGTELSGTVRPPLWAIGACAVYGAYVFFASRLARLEDDEDTGALGTRPARALMAASLCLALAPWLVALPDAPPRPGSYDWICGNQMMSADPVPERGSLLLWWLAPAAVVAGVSAAGLVREAIRKEIWTPGRVGRTAGMALRRLLIFTAAAAWCAPLADFPATSLIPQSVGGWILAPVILLGYPIALRLRRVFPPT